MPINQTSLGEAGPITAEGPTPLQAQRKSVSIIARLLHGTGAGVAAHGLGIASNLLLLPMYLHAWSVPLYGEWMTLYALVNYLGNLDFGVTTAAMNAATLAYAAHDWQTFRRVQGTAWATSLAIAGLGALLVMVISMFYFHVHHWLRLTVFDYSESRFVFCTLALSLLVGIPAGQLLGVYTATGQFARYQWLFNAFNLFSCSAIAVALGLGARPKALSLVILGTTLTTMGFSLFLLGRKNTLLYPRLHYANWQTARSLAAPTGQFGIAMVAGAISVQGPIVVLSRLLGGPSVALFTATRTITNAVRATLTMLRAPLRPEIGAASTRPNKDGLRRLFRIAVGLDATIAITLSAILWYGGEWLIRFWSQGRLKPDASLLHLLLLSSILEGFLQILAIAGWATNRIKAVSLAQLATAAISLLLAVMLMGRFGPSAVPLGALVPLALIMTPVALMNACSEVALSLRFAIGRLLLPFAGIAAFSVAFPIWVASLSITPVWVTQVLSTLVVCFATVGTSSFVFLTREDRRMMVRRVFKRLEPA